MGGGGGAGVQKGRTQGKGSEKYPVLYILPDFIRDARTRQRSLKVIQDLQPALLAKRALKDIY